jgi:nucleoside-diphosphate-sugar epimerase
VIPLFLDAMTTGRSPQVHGDGRQSRHFTFVSDAVHANLLAAEAAPQCSGRVYNVAGPHAHTLLDVLDVLSEVVDVRVEPIHTAPRGGDIRHSLADLSAAQRDLGYEPTIELSTGLRRTAESLMSAPAVRGDEALRE